MNQNSSNSSHSHQSDNVVDYINSAATICYLTNFDLFNSIPENERSNIEEQMKHGTFSTGEHIYTPQEKSNLIYFIKEGEVILYHEYEGKTEVFDTLGTGSLFGTFSLTEVTPSHFAETTRESKICSIPTPAFVDLIRSKPELTLRFFNSLADRIRDYELRFKNELYPAKERIIFELKRIQEKREKGLFQKFIPLRMTHEKIASITGLNRVTVTRSLGELKREGKISIDSVSGVIEIHSEGV